MFVLFPGGGGARLQGAGGEHLMLSSSLFTPAGRARLLTRPSARRRARRVRCSDDRATVEWRACLFSRRLFFLARGGRRRGRRYQSPLAVVVSIVLHRWRAGPPRVTLGYYFHLTSLLSVPFAPSRDLMDGRALFISTGTAF